MSAILQRHALSTSLLRRFKAVRNDRPIEEIATAMGLGFVTLYAWIAQDRITRLSVLAKIETWVNAQEAAQQPATTQV